MKRLVSLGLAVAAMAFGAVSAVSAQSDRAVERSGNVFHVKACPEHGQPGVARCHAHVVTDANGKVIAHAGTPQPSVNYNAGQLRAAYSIPWNGAQSTPNGPTIAIVDAYGYAKAESDLAAYRSQMNLPACTTANGCFTKVDQNGGTNYPAYNVGWAQETALDLDMVSAICPNCKILLVQGASANFNDLSAAVNYAAAHASVVSNSYGAAEGSFAQTYESAYTHLGVAITVSTGDSGYGVQYPASSPHVTAVGGTSLKMANGAYSSETAWSGAGSGCSSQFARPAWQSAVQGCTNRMVADVSAVADPATGVQVYGPASGTTSAWLVFGGTSAAAPIVAGAYGVHGGSYTFGSDPYLNGGSLHDVTSGSNGRCRGVASLLCNAVPGYDGPTGLGTPNGISAF